MPCAPAQAQEVFFGIYRHGVDTPLSIPTGEQGASLHAGYRFAPAEGLGILGKPQPYIFASVNTAGDTSMVGAGLSWKLGKGRVFVRPGIGVVVHDGPSVRLDEGVQMYTQLGSRVLFEPELALGARLSERVTAELSWVHVSHGPLFDREQNPGLDQLGLRISIRLGKR